MSDAQETAVSQASLIFQNILQKLPMLYPCLNCIPVMIIYFQTDKSQQTMNTLSRLLLKSLKSPMVYFKHLHLKVFKIKKLSLVCVVQIDKSVPVVTLWHYITSLPMSNSDPLERFVYLYLTHTIFIFYIIATLCNLRIITAFFGIHDFYDMSRITRKPVFGVSQQL